ncbi:MAG: HEAT repeat domain-containing protein, partial [Myxococcaceae bacterium]
PDHEPPAWTDADALHASAVEATVPDAPAPVSARIEVTRPALPREHGANVHADEALCKQIASELRTSMRGRSVVDLATHLGVTDERVIEAAALLTARGQVVRRGAKLFVA